MFNYYSNIIGQCRFEYRTQPPLSTVQDCNAYQGNIVKILLQCIVRRRTDVTDEFEIRWFRENTTGEVENLGRGFPDIAFGTDWLSRYHNTLLVNQQYNPSYAGKYWCQVINTTADPDQPLIRSNVFTLLPPENYTGTPCSGIGAVILQQIDNVTCADLPVHSELNTVHDTSTVTKATHLSHIG